VTHCTSTYRFCGPLTTRVRMFASGGGVVAQYNHLIASGEITADTRQQEVIDRLADLERRLHAYVPVTRQAGGAGGVAPASGGGGSFFGGLFGGGSAPAKPKPRGDPRLELLCPGEQKGLYIWGGTGCGKTFCMDMFFEKSTVKRKRRVHFHEFMIEVHDRLHRLAKETALVKDKAQTEWTAGAVQAQRLALQQNTPKAGQSADDLVMRIANDIFNESWLLCFDEFQVTHISDAIIMKRLFSILFEKGVIVVATSNRPPSDLYLNGLNRQLFTPFIPLLSEFCTVHAVGSETDYRLVTTAEENDRRVFITPLDDSSSALLERKFQRLCRSGEQATTTLEAKGRRIVVPRCSRSAKVGYFTFADLCDKPLGAEDYFVVANAFHTVFIKDIPKMTLQERDQVRRCITLIDCLYERHTKLVCTAGASPIELFTVSDEDRKTSTADEIFAWDRTVSRLSEMQSYEYLSQWAREMEGAQYLSMYQLSALDDDAVEDVWMRYGNTTSGIVGKDEIRKMLGDVFQATQGHRDVSDEVLAMCMAAMDPDGCGWVEEAGLKAGIRAYGIRCSWPQSRSDKLQNIVDQAFSIDGGVLAGAKFSLTVADPAIVGCPLVGVSAGFTEMTGYHLHETLGRSCGFLLTGVPHQDIDANMRSRSRDFVAQVMADVKSHAEGAAPAEKKEMLILQENARKDGDRFTNLFLMREVVIERSPFIVGVQAEVDGKDQGAFKSLACGAVSAEVTEAHRQEVARLSQRLAIVEDALKKLIPRLQ